MTASSKAFRAIGSAALGLAMMAGIGTSMVSAEPVNVSLVSDPNTCSVTLTSGSSFEMGSYEWTGAQYEAQPGAGTATIAGTLDASGAPGTRNCHVSIVSSNVTDGTNVAFTADQVSITDGSTTLPLFPAQSGDVNNIPLGGYTGSATITLPSITTAFVPAGNYSGTITITASSL